MGADLELLWLLAVHLVLTGLPAALAVFVAARRGLRDVPLLLCVALAASGAAAMLSFWAFYLDPLVGQVAAFLLALGSAQGIYLCRPDRLDRELLRELAAPAALWALASLFVVYLGFLYGGSEGPLTIAATRFSHPLPPDNQIPLHFANWYYENGSSPTPPPFGDWLSSDRPPLQVGYVLSQRAFGWDESGLHYQVLAVVVQQLWVVAMWALLVAARLRPLARGLAIVAAMVSDIAIVHGFFVWPKLIAAAFVLAALAMVVSGRWSGLREDWRAGALFAALCGFAMLAHGASAFAVIPLLGYAVLRGIPSLRWLAAAALVAVALLGSWSAYQRFADPPGDRLLKWQLGGALAIDDRGALEAIVDGYEEAGFDGTLANKRANAEAIVRGKDLGEALDSAADGIGGGEPGQTVEALRLPRFFWLFPFLGLLLLGPLAMLVARIRGRPEGAEWRFALTSLGFSLAVAATWALLLFGGSEAPTTIHQGTLLLPLLAVCGCVVGAFAAWRPLGIGLAALSVLLALALYAPAPTLEPRSFSLLAALLAAAGLAGFGWVALRTAPR
ncbi:MAG TPA: hypothetical protein VFY04_00075 [Solirubrobacterales bacterium]|nr:hypothetical protein [Solirubrobacterales bacterium]